jgi:hypothetical protein
MWYPYEIDKTNQNLLNETYSRNWVGNNLSDMFSTRNGLKQGDDLSPLLFNFVWNMSLGGFKYTKVA